MPIPHEKKVNVLEKSPAPDVLTVQDREGIGSVWRDPLPPPTCAFDEPQSNYSSACCGGGYPHQKEMLAACMYFHP